MGKCMKISHNSSTTRIRFEGGRRFRICWGGGQRTDLVGRGRIEASIVHGHDLPSHRQFAALQQNGGIERIINSSGTHGMGLHQNPPNIWLIYVWTHVSIWLIYGEYMVNDG